MESNNQDQVDMEILKQKIIELGLWDFFIYTNPPPNVGYLWWDHKHIITIMNGVCDELNYHSAGTLALLFRQLKDKEESMTT
jgi:hypothetical protein